MTTPTDQKPSAEVQAIVMNLWNVIRETAQATTAIHAENKAFAQKYHALGEQLQHEHERHTKLQAYTEHLQAELKQNQHDLEALQPQHLETLEISQKREETIQELRRILQEQEELVLRQSEENKTLSEQLMHESEGHDTESERLRTNLETLKQDLAASRQQSLDVATEVDDLRTEVETLSAERNQLLDDNEQLRWRLEAFEKNSAQEHGELEHKLEAARVYSGEVMVQLEDAKRLMSESDARINALTLERASLQEAVEKVEQEALTWQQIAEEQTADIQRMQTRERELSALLEEAQKESSADLASQLAASKSLYETALENLKAQLQAERIQHQQAMEAHANEHEQVVSGLEEQILTLKAEFEKQAVELKRETIYLGKDDRLALTGKISHLLQRVEAALAEHEE